MRRCLFASVRFAKDQPIAVLPPTMVGNFPFRVHDRPLPYLNDAIASAKPDFPRGQDKIHVRPLVAVMMYVVGNFAEQNTFRAQHAPRLAQKRREGVGKVILQLLWYARP